MKVLEFVKNNKHPVAYGTFSVLLAVSLLFNMRFSNGGSANPLAAFPTPTEVATVSAMLSPTAGASASVAPVKCVAKQMNPSDPQSFEPDPNCTPGVLNAAVTQATINSTICVKGYTSTIRPSASYTNHLKVISIGNYGYADKNLKDYEEDHFISLEIGGNPTDPANLWAQPGASVNEKDRVEDYLHREVCDGHISLAEAQHEITSDWYAVYKSVFTTTN